MLLKRVNVVYNSYRYVDDDKTYLISVVTVDNSIKAGVEIIEKSHYLNRSAHRRQFCESYNI